MNGRPWTPEEDDLLRAFFASPDCPFAELASRLGRSIQSVRRRATVLHLRLSHEVRSEIARVRWDRVPVEKRKTMGRHLVALKQEQRHRALSADVPPWCKMVRAAVEERFGGDRRMAAAACQRSPDDRALHLNHLWEIMRGWKYVYSKKNGHRVRKRQPILYPSTATVNRLCTGLHLNREKLLAALKASGGCLLEERRSEIAKHLDRPVSKITSPRERRAKKQQVAHSADARRGKGKNPKNKARLRSQWDALKEDPERRAQAVNKVRSALARFQHPSPTDRMLRGWHILVAWCRRRHRIPSPPDMERYVEKWADRLGLTVALVQRYVDRFQNKPHAGWEPDLDLYVFVRGLKDAGLTRREIAQQVDVEFGVTTDPEVFRKEYQRFARAYFQPVKPRLRPFHPRRRWTPQEIDEVRTLYTAGTPLAEIGARFNRTPDALKTLATKLGVRRPPIPTTDSPPVTTP